MDLNSSLDDIIGSRTKPSSRRKSHASSSFSPSRSTFRPSPRHDTHRHDHGSNRPDLRSRINYRSGDLHHRPRDDLRGRIGKRGNSNGGGLTTANLPNRQKYQQQRGAGAGASYDNGNNSDMETHDTHGLIITKSVHRHGLSPSSITSSSFTRSSRTGFRKGNDGDNGNDLDPASIVITKKIENTRNMSPPPPSSRLEQQQQQHNTEHQQLLQQLQEAERLKQYYQQQQQQQQEQQLRQEMDRHLQQQLKSQRELILDLQRQLEQRTSHQSLLQQQSPQQQQRQTMELGGNFSFRAMVNNNNQYNEAINPYNRSAPNIVLLSNLDPNATVHDVKAACGAFGPVTRCELIKDTRGRSVGEAEIEYLDRQSALDCIAKFDTEIIDGRLIRATLRQPPTQQVRSVIAPTRSGYRTTSQVHYTSKRP